MIGIVDCRNKKHEHTFLDLVTELDKVEGIERLRISSIEPNLLKNETIDFVAKSNSFVPHFHIPLQSGSDPILKLMRRRYLSDLYVDRIKRIKRAMPHACIGVDVIVGFPGETEELFNQTLNHLKEWPWTRIHVFPYSERGGTRAALMPDSVPVAVRKERARILRELSCERYDQKAIEQVGNIKEVISLKSSKENGVSTCFWKFFNATMERSSGDKFSFFRNTSTTSSISLPIKARATGELTEILPFSKSASC